MAFALWRLGRLPVVLGADVAPEAGLVGELEGALPTLEHLEVIVRVHVALEVALEVEALATEVTLEGRVVEVHLVDVAAQPVVGGERRVAELAHQWLAAAAASVCVRTLSCVVGRG